MEEELEYPDFFGDAPIFSDYEIERPKKEELATEETTACTQ